MATKNSNALTADRARKLLDYDPETGILRWRVNHAPRARAGDEAGWIRPDGGRNIRIDGRIYFAHRLAFLIVEGRWPHGEIDHEDHNRSNNRWKNLEETDHQSNQRNQSLPRNNTSGHIGVSWHKASRKWHARIKLNGIYKSLGRFDDLAAASTARKAAEAEYGYHRNHGRIA